MCNTLDVNQTFLACDPLKANKCLTKLLVLVAYCPFPNLQAFVLTERSRIQKIELICLCKASLSLQSS